MFAVKARTGLSSACTFIQINDLRFSIKQPLMLISFHEFRLEKTFLVSYALWDDINNVNPTVNVYLPSSSLNFNLFSLCYHELSSQMTLNTPFICHKACIFCPQDKQGYIKNFWNRNWRHMNYIYAVTEQVIWKINTRFYIAKGRQIPMFIDEMFFVLIPANTENDMLVVLIHTIIARILVVCCQNRFVQPGRFSSDEKGHPRDSRGFPERNNVLKRHLTGMNSSIFTTAPAFFLYNLYKIGRVRFKWIVHLLDKH